MPTFTYDNTAPTEKGIPYFREVVAKTTGNIDLTNPPATIDAVVMSGWKYGAQILGTAILVGSQTSPAENGVYMLTKDDTLLATVSGSFSGGAYTLSGLTADRLYAVQTQAGITSVSNGSVGFGPLANSAGEYWIIIKASGTGTLTFQGPSSGSAASYIGAWGAKMVAADLPGVPDYNALGNLFRVTGGTANANKFFSITAISGAGVITLTELGSLPAGLLVQYTNIAPTEITP